MLGPYYVPGAQYVRKNKPKTIKMLSLLLGCFLSIRKVRHGKKELSLPPSGCVSPVKQRYTGP